MSNATGLVARNVSKIYTSGAKEVRAVDGVSFEIAKGGSVAVLGPSGAGKSTLLHLLGGLDTPTGGSIEFDGTDIAKLPDAERSRMRNSRVGFVFQFYHLLPEFTALENVLLPALIRGSAPVIARSPAKGGTTKQSHSRARDLLKLVGLEDRMSHRPGQLSGGESQRVAIARALINQPDYLLCDEPTGNLDSKNSDAILDLLFALQSQANVSLVIVTHDESLSRRTHATIRMKDGKLVV